MIRHNPDTQDQWGYHYLHDVLGSVIGLVDDAGELVERYTYDPYGKVFIEEWDATANGGTGAWLASAEPTSGLPVSSFGNPFMWTGHRYDAAVGLYATLYRTYSPTLGRWLQRDPIEYAGGSISQYEYVSSDALDFRDPLGLCPILFPEPEKAKKDECKESCKQLKISCILTGSVSPFLELSRRCNECQKRCDAECEHRKEQNEKQGIRNDKNYGDAWYWWVYNCNTYTQLWRLPGERQGTETEEIARTWRDHFWTIVLARAMEECGTRAAQASINCAKKSWKVIRGGKKSKAGKKKDLLKETVEEVVGFDEVWNDLQELYRIYRDYGITFPR